MSTSKFIPIQFFVGFACLQFALSSLLPLNAECRDHIRGLALNRTTGILALTVATLTGVVFLRPQEATEVIGLRSANNGKQPLDVKVFTIEINELEGSVGNLAVLLKSVFEQGQSSEGPDWPLEMISSLTVDLPFPHAELDENLQDLFDAYDPIIQELYSKYIAAIEEGIPNLAAETAPALASLLRRQFDETGTISLPPQFRRNSIRTRTRSDRFISYHGNLE